MFNPTKQQKQRLFWLKYTITAVAILIWLFFFSGASIADTPGFYEGGGDKSDVDSKFEAIINLILYFGMGIGLVSLAAGIVMSLPLIGKKEKGMDIIKTSAIVIIACALFWFGVYIFGDAILP